jgi:hypothetical protein
MYHILIVIPIILNYIYHLYSWRAPFHSILSINWIHINSASNQPTRSYKSSSCSRVKLRSRRAILSLFTKVVGLSGKILDDTATLLSYNIENEHTLIAVCKPKDIQSSPPVVQPSTQPTQPQLNPSAQSPMMPPMMPGFPQNGMPDMQAMMSNPMYMTMMNNVEI